MMLPLWPTQERGIEGVNTAIEAGWKRILLTGPTGAGKTRIECELIDRWCDQDLKVVLYTNRKMLVEQTSRVLAGHGIDHGTRAAGYDDDGYFPVQVSSIQTENSRVYKKGTWNLHDANRVLIDEAHLQTGGVARKIMQAHVDAGAIVVGLTATPIGLGDMYEHLVVAGTTSELRACGALVPAHHYGPDEPDLKKLKKLQAGQDLSETQQRSVMMTPTIWGRVWEWYEKLNPEHKPTILFAPGVQESIWFAEQFEVKGVKAAHIDGEDVWRAGKLTKTSRRLREEVMDASRTGDIRVLCNRFVLREGIDLPWLAHGILATVFGSLQTNLQAGGRLLRAYPGLEYVTIQDHGGNWWRHGSLNADRVWSLGHTSHMIAAIREDRLRNKNDTGEREPYRCPKCALILNYPRCRRCGWEPRQGEKKARPVVSTDGELKEMKGDIFKPRRIYQKPDGPKLWERMYYRSKTKKGERTFRAAAGLFCIENNWQWPDPRWPLMPTTELDWFLPVAEVPIERLTQ